MARIKAKRKIKITILTVDLNKLKTKPIDTEKLSKIEAARNKLIEKGEYKPVSQHKKVSFKGDFKQTPKLEHFVRPSKKKKTKKKRKTKLQIDQIEFRKRLPYADFLKTRYWKEVRQLVLARDGKMCVICKATKRLDIHHDSYKHHGDEKNHLEDLMTLCRDCHTEHHNAQP